jgi:predicted negative regulator of RcsB-dependent stress response
MQAAARELANVVQDAAKGRVIAAVGQQASEELAELLNRARVVSRTLYAENEHLTAVNPKNQKAVNADLKRAKEDLDKGVAAEAAQDFDKALNQYANAWDDTVRAMEEAAKAR